MEVRSYKLENLLIVGVDVSINNTGLCFRTVNGSSVYKLFQITPKESNVECTVKNLTYKRITNEEIHDDVKLVIGANNLANVIVNKIEQVATQFKIKKPNIIVCFEGNAFAMPAKKSRLADLSQYSGIVKLFVASKFGANCVEVFAPGTIKKVFTGNGRANKDLMVETFIKNIDENFGINQKGIKKDDVVDAFAITETYINKHKNIIKNIQNMNI